MDSKAFKIVLVVNPSEDQFINLFDFMLVTMRHLSDGETRAPAPKSIADYILNSVYSFTETGMDDIETALYQISLECRNGLNEACEKYCINVIKEMKKIIKKKYK